MNNRTYAPPFSDVFLNYKFNDKTAVQNYIKNIKALTAKKETWGEDFASTK